MVDRVAGGVSAIQHESARESRISSSRKQTPWFSIVLGVLLTCSLFALKVTALGLDEQWGFVADLRALGRNPDGWREIAWHSAQWADIAVFTLEALIAGAAGSIVFNYAVNNISQTISNIWQQIDLTGSPDPTITRVEPETRAWLSGLTHESAARAAEAMRAQEVRIEELIAEISRLRAQNAGLDSDIEARNAKLSDAFAMIIDQIRKLREDVSRGGAATGPAMP